jgi:phosphatidate cytidylyltransferase
MLRARLIIVILALPIMAYVIATGGDLFLIGLALTLVIAATEYVRMFRRGGFRPSQGIVVGGVLAFAISRHMLGFDYSGLIISGTMLIAMTWHVLDYESGAPRSGIDLTITVTGMLYLGWLGSYLLSLRAIEDGLWWFLIVLPSVWVADSAAYFVGLRFGRRQLATKVSPGKTWEGYLSGIPLAGLAGAAFTVLWNLSGSVIEPINGAMLGGILGALAPLGDLGISLLKREMQIKDTGSLLPGHGGVLDRIDSWLWAGVIGYYLITAFFIE